ncbi:hypothetical protein ACVWXU_008247 [Streptomyces sp. TE33382]
MNDSRCELLRWQFDLTWSLFDYHLDRLEPEDFLWEPVGLCWTVRRGSDGTWVPDWAESEPTPFRSRRRAGSAGISAGGGA